MDKLGILWSSLIIQIVNFSILVFLLQKFLFKPLVKKLDERSDKVKAIEAQEEDIKKQTEEIQQQKIDSQKTTQKQAAQIIAVAKKEADNQSDKLLAASKTKAEDYRQKLEIQAAFQLEEYKKEAARHTLDISAQLVRRVLAEVVNEADQQKILSSAIKRLETTKDL